MCKFSKYKKDTTNNVLILICGNRVYCYSDPKAGDNFNPMTTYDWIRGDVVCIQRQEFSYGWHGTNIRVLRVDEKTCTKGLTPIHVSGGFEHMFSEHPSYGKVPQWMTAMIVLCRIGVVSEDDIKKRFDNTPEKWGIIQKWSDFKTLLIGGKLKQLSMTFDMPLRPGQSPKQSLKQRK